MGKPFTQTDREMIDDVVKETHAIALDFESKFLQGKTGNGETMNLIGIENLKKAMGNAVHLVASVMAQEFIDPAKHQYLMRRLHLLRELSADPAFFTSAINFFEMYRKLKK